MNKLIRKIFKEQINLVEPVSIDGTTEKIRQHAKSYICELEELLKTNIDGEYDDDFIKKHKNTILNCCRTLYNKLCDDTRTLPTFELINIAEEEANEIMKVWETIERNY
jgi:hypothetical protein